MAKKAPRQLTIYDQLYSKDSSALPETTVEEKILYNKIHVNHSTFLSGLSARVHRWFRLTPSFGPDLVQEMLATLQCGQKDVVLDPFAGAGTTMIESQIEGLTSYGFEINPFLHFVGNTCLEWNLDVERLKQALNVIEKKYLALSGLVNLNNLEKFGLSMPSIHNPTRWWRPDILANLIVLSFCIESDEFSDSEKNFFKLALAAVLVPDLTNVTLGRLQLHFIDRTGHDIRAFDTFLSHALTMIDDIAEITREGLKQTSRIFLTDTTNIESLRLGKKVNCVITSPPYPNRYSYVWNTRPHLYMLKFFDNAKQAADLDKATIGGTWGTATSVLAKGTIQPKYQVIKNVVSPVVEAIRESDNLMANYAMKYFNLLADQIVEMEKVIAPNVRVAYVVGCSRLKEVYVETDVLLGKIFEGLGLGYKVSSVERIRKRHSGKDLHESIVYAWKK
jgi:DNA modification methylase